VRTKRAANHTLPKSKFITNPTTITTQTSKKGALF